ncbi:MAG: hypothetical protein IT307_00975 [Chloroflexi bacterium]|nr:hypothetical protein [Chloroflexota bacterium]
MSPPRRQESDRPDVAALSAARAATLSSADPVAGVPGPGHWLVSEWAPVGLFSLKVSTATSSVGRTLVVPTPYAIKMACVDAAFRAGLPDADCAALLVALAPVEVRIRPPAAAAVTHTIVKVRQEPKKATPGEPYISSVAYREVVHHAGSWLWAFDLAAADNVFADRLVRCLPRVNYVGKRGSFVQFLGFERRTELDASFTAVYDEMNGFTMPPAWHIQPLDDFGPEATLGVLSSYSPAPARRDRHRVFRSTIIPLGLASSGPGFSEYRAEL